MDAGKESACYTSTDRLTSGSLRLLIDTKETGAHAHSLSHTLCLHTLGSEPYLSGFWMISVAVLFQVEAEKERFFFSPVLIQLESVQPRLVLYSLTQRMFSNRSSFPPSFLFVSRSHMCFLCKVFDWICCSERCISGGEVGAESNRSGFVWLAPLRRLWLGLFTKTPSGTAPKNNKASSCKFDQHLKPNKQLVCALVCRKRKEGWDHFPLSQCSNMCLHP